MVKRKRTHKNATAFDLSNDTKRKRSHAVDTIGAIGTQYIFDTIPENDVIAPENDRDYQHFPSGVKNKLCAIGRAGSCHWVHIDSAGNKNCSYKNGKQIPGSNQLCQWFAYNSYKGNPMKLNNTDSKYQATQKVVQYVKKKRTNKEKQLHDAWWEQTGDHFPQANANNWGVYLDQAINLVEETPPHQAHDILEIKDDPDFAEGK